MPPPASPHPVSVRRYGRRAFVELYPGLAKERAWAGDRQIEAFVLNRS
jgi:hypothetical protein